MGEQREWTAFEAMVNASDGRPFVKMTCGVGDELVFSTKMSPALCTALGLRGVQAAIEAERDAGFVACILDMGMEEQMAGMLLAGLRAHREQFDAATGSMAKLGGDDRTEMTDAPDG